MCAPASMVAIVDAGDGGAGDAHDVEGRQRAGRGGTAAANSSSAARRNCCPASGAHVVDSTSASSRNDRGEVSRRRRPPRRAGSDPKNELSSTGHEPMSTTPARYAHGAGISSTGSSPTPMTRSAASSTGRFDRRPGHHAGVEAGAVADDAPRLVRGEDRDVRPAAELGRARAPRRAPRRAREPACRRRRRRQGAARRRAGRARVRRRAGPRRPALGSRAPDGADGSKSTWTGPGRGPRTRATIAPRQLVRAHRRTPPTRASPVPSGRAGRCADGRRGRARTRRRSRRPAPSAGGRAAPGRRRSRHSPCPGHA